jgi:hypothetical protein
MVDGASPVETRKLFRVFILESFNLLFVMVGIWEKILRGFIPRSLRGLMQR